MFFQAAPFDKRAAFLFRNVCDFPSSLIPENIQSTDKEDILAGLEYFSALLREIYADSSTYRTEDDLESYHRLTNTVQLLLVAGTCGTLLREGEISHILLEKALIRRHFKKPAAFHLGALENYGFYFAYEKNGRPAKDYNSCTTVAIYNESCAAFLPALNYLAQHIPAMDNKKDFAMQTDLFLMADYKTILLGGAKRKEDIVPLRPEILRTLGEKAACWTELVINLTQEAGLKASCKFWSYCSPAWVVHFHKKGKSACIFTISTDSLFFEWCASYEVLKDLAENKEQLPPLIKSCMEGFGCIHCGVCRSENVTLVNGFSLCTKEAWARRITFDFTTQAHIQAVQFLLAL